MLNEEATRKIYQMGAVSGMMSTSESMLAVIDKALEDGIETSKVIEILRTLGQHSVEQSRTQWTKMLEELADER